MQRGSMLGDSPIEERFFDCVSRRFEQEQKQKQRRPPKKRGGRYRGNAQARNTLLGITTALALGAEAISREAAKGVQCPQFPGVRVPSTKEIT
jgi:hypothetical protein